MKNLKIKLRDVASDTITGFEGTVVGVTHWLNGCSRLALQPKGLHEGKVIEAEWFDSMQLELVTAKGYKPDDATATGGPRPDPSRSW